MRKFSRREKRILKLLAAVCLVAIVLDVEARFREARDNLVLEIENQRSNLDVYLNSLRTDTTAGEYKEKTAAIEVELETFRDRILELPRESDATLLIKETVDNKAKELGMNISSISSRRSKELVKDQPMRELKTYFAFDSDLESLLEFFDSLSRQGYFMVIETMTLGTRRRVTRRGRNKRAKTNQRPPLNGNALITTLFLNNQEGSLDNYLNGANATKGSGETSKDEMSPKQENPKTKTAGNKPGATGQPKKNTPKKTSSVPLIDGSEKVPNMKDQIDAGNGETLANPYKKIQNQPQSEVKENPFKQNLTVPPRPLTGTTKKQNKLKKRF